MTTPTPTPAPQQGLPLDQYIAGQVAQPTLPTGAEFTPTLLATDAATLQNTGQLMTGTNAMMQPNTNIIAPQQVVTPTITATQGQGQVIDPNAPLANFNPQTGQYQAAQIGANSAQGVAEQGTVSNMATVQGQLANLYAQSQPGMVPDWAKGAVTAANQVSAARGIGASSIGVAAIASAIQQSALPIAAQDASTYFQMDMTNLSNRQQMAFENLKNRQQSLLSDQAAVNASRQFNASSESQVQQFMSTMVSNIMTQNADRLQAMSQFNVGQENQVAAQNVSNQINVGQFNAQQEAAIAQFNSQQQFAREQFNANAAFAIEQSNVLWRRNINTENTAAINAANQTNAQNRYDLSATAQNQLWQQWRDEASWIFEASENERNRQFNLAMAANNREFYNPEAGSNWGSAVGSFVAGLLI
jgi:hypothetical protein